MAEYLVIRLGSDPDALVNWIAVNGSGGGVHGTGQGGAALLGSPPGNIHGGAGGTQRLGDTAPRTPARACYNHDPITGQSHVSPSFEPCNTLPSGPS